VVACIADIEGRAQGTTCPPLAGTRIEAAGIELAPSQWGWWASRVQSGRVRDGKCLGSASGSCHCRCRSCCRCASERRRRRLRLAKAAAEAWGRAGARIWAPRDMPAEMPTTVHTHVDGCGER